MLETRNEQNTTAIGIQHLDNRDINSPQDGYEIVDSTWKTDRSYLAIHNNTTHDSYLPYNAHPMAHKET